MRGHERLRALLGHGRLLVVVSVAAEREALQRGNPGLIIEVAGVGPAAAAATTARALATGQFSAVASVGIGGGLAGRAQPGDLVLATRSIAADLGADSPTGFLPIDELGLGASTVAADPTLLRALREALPTAVAGDILSVSTVTGTAATTTALTSRFPDAAAEGMEGFGVATACAQVGIPFAELRAISNVVGPRDREAWHIPQALAALTAAAPALAATVER